MTADPERTEFLERIRRQVAARYPGSTVTTDVARFGLHVHQAGADVTLPLTPLHLAVSRQPARTAELVAEYVRSVEQQLTPVIQHGQFALHRARWCVRSRRYMAELSRSGELLTTALGDDLVAFVSETLPGVIMRGVPREEWRSRGIDDSAVREAADTATREHFARTLDRLRSATAAPRDGWRIGGDQLFQGSVLMIPEVLQRLVELAGGDVLLGVPDRSLVLAVPAAAEGASAFASRVNRDYREGMSSCSKEILVTDGTSIRTATAPKARRGGLMAWLED